MEEFPDLSSEQNEIVCRLLGSILAYALLEKPFPGQEIERVFFPDVWLLEKQVDIILAKWQAESECLIEIEGRIIHILSQEEIRARTETQGSYPYFQLSEVNVGEMEAILSLQLVWASSEEDEREGVRFLGGGGVRVQFERVDEEWHAPQGPIATWMS